MSAAMSPQAALERALRAVLPGRLAEWFKAPVLKFYGTRINPTEVMPDRLDSSRVFDLDSVPCLFRYLPVLGRSVAISVAISVAR